MAFSQSLHAKINGLHVVEEKEPTCSLHAKVPQPLFCQEPNHLPSTMVVAQNDLPNVVFATRSPEVTANDFEDGEVFTNTPVVVESDSPSRLTWAGRASSGEFIPQEALELEEEYGGFSVNPNFLHCSVNHSHGETNNGGGTKGSHVRGELHASVELASTHRAYLRMPQAQSDCQQASTVARPNLSQNTQASTCYESSRAVRLLQQNLPPISTKPSPAYAPSTDVTFQQKHMVWPNPHSANQQLQHSTRLPQPNPKATCPLLHKHHLTASVQAGSVLASVHVATHASYVSVSNPMAGNSGGEKEAYSKAISSISLGPSDDAAASQYGSLAGAHIAVAQSSDGALNASHGIAKGQALLVKYDIHYSLQQLSQKGTNVSIPPTAKPIPCHH
ncbi:hypothetical protein F0562_003378 [Nyssa sinensis]|uniref:Uncharacterized protein n=1 Tax=Nyssa sinensis TaxID=561372 RepID=A0A5J5BVD0_9ASTE|nr:hypothetical protein F0562_003378 [Nyssa sinensis]